MLSRWEDLFTTQYYLIVRMVLLGSYMGAQFPRTNEQYHNIRRQMSGNIDTNSTDPAVRQTISGLYPQLWGICMRYGF